MHSPLRCAAALVAATVVLASCTDNVDNPSPSRPELGILSNRVAHQVDRFGLPAIATVFIPTNEKDHYNAGMPSTDRSQFLSFVVSKLQAFGNPNPTGLANALLPDMQPYDYTQATGFLNGRRLQDDVITAELGLIFGSNPDLNDDHVDTNDVPFLSTFPYLATPHI